MLSGFSDFLEDCNLSSETQGQLVGAGRSRSKRAREKNWGEEKLDFFPPPLTAPGSPGMIGIMNIVIRQRRRQMRFLSSLPWYKSQYQYSGKHLHTVFWLLELF